MSTLRTAIVTGAGTGIGRAVAETLAEAGFRLALVGRTESSLEETARALGGESESIVVPADVARPAAAAGVVDRVMSAWGRVDLLVNNAGVAPLRPIDETNAELLDETFAVNAFGPAHLIARVWPVFVTQGGGCVVNVSTLGTRDPFPGFFAYAASKSALESLGRSVAIEGAAHGITAYSVAPGAVEAPALRRLFSEDDLPAERTLKPRVVAEIVRECAEGRRPEPSGATIEVPGP